MKLIVGLGNPGKRLIGTRHNIGFMFVDYWLRHLKINIDFKKSGKFQALYLKTKINQNEYIFLKPLTFMNNSGQAVRNVVDYYKINISDIVLAYDDLDIPFGQLKLVKKSPRKHFGINSVINCLKRDDFIQIRLGISGEDYLHVKKSGLSIADNYVLKTFSNSEKKELECIFQKALDKYQNIYNNVY